MNSNRSGANFSIHTDSLRLRLLLLVVIAILLPFILLFYSAVHGRRIAADSVNIRIQQGVEQVAAAMANTVEGAHQLLIATSETIRGSRPAPASFNHYLQSVIGKLPQYVNIGVVDQEGKVLYSALPLKPAGTVNLSDRLWFKRAVETGRFSVGEYIVGRITGRKSLGFSYPVRRAGGRSTAIIYTSLDLEWLSKTVQSQWLDPEAAVSLVDGYGITLASTDPRRPAGSPFFDADPAARIKELSRQGTAEMVGPEGRDYVYAGSVVRGTNEWIFAVIEIPKNVVLAKVDRLLLQNLGWLTFTALLLFVVTWKGSELLVLRPVHTVIATTKRLREGNLSARTGLSGTGEIGQLGASFDEMARALMDQEQKRNKAEEERERLIALREGLLRRLELQYERMPFGCIVMAPDFVIWNVNPAAAVMFGYREEELIGKNLYGSIMPEDAGSSREGLITGLASGTGTIVQINENRTKDGRTIICEWHNTPLCNESDRVVGIMSMIQDITESRRSHEALRSFMDRFNALTQAAPLAIVASDRGGIITLWNAAAERIFGWKAEEVIGGPSPLDVDAGRKPPDAICERVNGGETITAVETVRRSSSGALIDVSLSSAPLRDANGEIVGVLCIYEDIGNRKSLEKDVKKAYELMEQKVAARTLELTEANKRLQELDRLKSLFIASMSHELRTPLNSVIGFSSVLANEWSGPLNDEQKEQLFAILRSGKHLLDLINDVIDVSKIEAGTIDRQVDDFDLHDVLTESAGRFAQQLADKNVALDYAEFHQPMRTDRRRLLQCVDNLISNAAKFTERGSVRISARVGAVPPGGNRASVAISVEDSGIGIRSEDLPRLFQPFTRLDSLFRTRILGTGLGLYLTRKLATEVLGGEVSVESRDGEGSTFTLTVPLRVKAESGNEDQ